MNTPHNTIANIDYADRYIDIDYAGMELRYAAALQAARETGRPVITAVQNSQPPVMDYVDLLRPDRPDPRYSWVESDLNIGDFVAVMLEDSSNRVLNWHRIEGPELVGTDFFRARVIDRSISNLNTEKTYLIRLPDQGETLIVVQIPAERPALLATEHLELMNLVAGDISNGLNQTTLSRSITFNLDGQEVIRLERNEFFYRGQLVEDAHRVYELFTEWMFRAQGIEPPVVSSPDPAPRKSRYQILLEKAHE